LFFKVKSFTGAAAGSTFKEEGMKKKRRINTHPSLYFSIFSG